VASPGRHARVYGPQDFLHAGDVLRGEVHIALGEEQLVEGHFHVGEQGEARVLECRSRPGCSGIGRFLAGLPLAGPFKRLFHRKRTLGHTRAGARVANGATPGAAGDGGIRIGACRNLLALALFHHPLGAGQCGVVLHRQRQNIRQGIGGGAWRFSPGYGNAREGAGGSHCQDQGTDKTSNHQQPPPCAIGSRWCEAQASPCERYAIRIQDVRTDDD
jgi:hypothetical protein